MKNILEIIKERRTIRRFTTNQIEKNKLDAIIEAGLWAPSAGGRQSPVMLVCSNKETNLLLGKINRNIFGGALKTNTHAVNQSQLSIADDNSLKNGFYDAPTVITLFAPENFRYAPNDCTAAAQNMMLTAWDLGIGCVYVGRAEETFATDEGRELMLKSGIAENYKACVCLCLGYPASEPGEPKERKENRVFYA